MIYSNMFKVIKVPNDSFSAWIIIQWPNMSNVAINHFPKLNDSRAIEKIWLFIIIVRCFTFARQVIVYHE